MQTLSSELASSPQVKHATFGVLVACLSSWVNPLHFSVQIWPWCFSSQLHILSSSMAFLPAKRSGMQLLPARFQDSSCQIILPFPAITLMPLQYETETTSKKIPDVIRAGGNAGARQFEEISELHCLDWSTGRPAAGRKWTGGTWQENGMSRRVLSVRIVNKGVQSPEIVMVNVLEFESNPVVFDSDRDYVGYYIDSACKRNIYFYVLTYFNTFICSQKKSTHAYIFQNACKIAIFCHYRSFMIDGYPAE
jgi:hypothetical protein